MRHVLLFALFLISLVSTISAAEPEEKEKSTGGVVKGILRRLSTPRLGAVLPGASSPTSASSSPHSTSSTPHTPTSPAKTISFNLEDYSCLRNSPKQTPAEPNVSILVQQAARLPKLYTQMPYYKPLSAEFVAYRDAMIKEINAFAQAKKMLLVKLLLFSTQTQYTSPREKKEVDTPFESTSRTHWQLVLQWVNARMETETALENLKEEAERRRIKLVSYPYLNRTDYMALSPTDTISLGMAYPYEDITEEEAERGRLVLGDIKWDPPSPSS